MRIVYLGTPDFAVLPLEELVNSGYNVVAVITNPDRPVGRKQLLTPPPVKVKALELNIPVYQYEKIRVQGVEDLKSLAPDLMITCAFGQILSQEILDIPKYGVFNIHASLLPKYRGASPIHYAILNGEKKTGITIMKTDIGVDTGDIILQNEIDILDGETTGELFNRLSVLGAKSIVNGVKMLENGQICYKKQDENQASHSKMIKKEDAIIDWDLDALNVVNKIRAFNPAPIAFTFYKGEQLKIYSATVVNFSGSAGEVLENNGKLVVACKSNAISIEKVQKAGGKAMNIVDFLRGNKIEKGEKLGQC